MEIYLPNILLIAGSGQNTGKTEFACRIITKFSKQIDLVALKISSRRHKTAHLDNVLHESESCIITLETSPDTGKDTSRMLKAGAKKVYYLQVKDNNILQAIINISELYNTHTPVICESGSLRNFIKPGLFIFMTAQPAFLKNSELSALADMRILTTDVSKPEYLAHVRFFGGKWELKKPKSYKTRKVKTVKVSEPQAAYGTAPDKTIRFFSSFEEENEYVARERYLLSYDERMIYAEQLRKFMFKEYLLPDGTWPPLIKILILKKPHT